MHLQVVLANLPDARSHRLCLQTAREATEALRGDAVCLLLQEALEESLERYESNPPDSVSASSKTKATNPNALRAPAHSGLDMLIRQTIDIRDLSTDETTGKKRLTVAVDRPKLEKLKAIAKLENAFLKDLLVSLIDDYIEEYTQGKDLSL